MPKIRLMPVIAAVLAAAAGGAAFAQIRPPAAAASAPAAAVPSPVRTPATAASAPANAASAAAEVVATVNGAPLTRGELERRLRQLQAVARVEDTPALRERIREEMVAEELLFQEAVRQNVDQSPAFVQAMAIARRDALARVMLQLAPAAAVTPEQVRKVYDDSIAGLAPNDLRLRAIVVDSQEKIRSVRTALAKGAAFNELAQQNSLLPSARAGGDLGWVNLRQPGKDAGAPLPAPVIAEVRKLAKGGFTQPVSDGRNGWWIVKLEDQRPSQALPFEQVRERLRQALEQQARNEAAAKLLADLRANASIQVGR